MKKDYSPGKKEFQITQKYPEYQKFQIMHVAGQGTFGVVFKVRHEEQIRALKITLQQKKYRNRELDVISQLKHFNVISVIDKFFIIDSDQQFLNLVMDYFPSNLHEVFKSHQKNKTKFTHKQIKIISFQLFKALAYLQDKKVCHRDIKPQNILINYETLQVKICDFGSAKFMNKKQNNVVYICSRYYRAPQLIFGQSDYSFEIDMWSIGCVLVEMLSFDPIFPGSSNLQQLLQIIKILGIPKQSDGYICEQQLRKLSRSIKPIKWSNIVQFYRPEPGFVDLISRILIFSRQKRLKPAQSLIHPYFQQIWNQPPKQLPHLLNFSYNAFNGYQQQKQVLINKSKEKSIMQQTVCCTPEQQH